MPGDWPAIPLDRWKDTAETLQLWTQVLGKLQLKLRPFVNHWWESSFTVTPRGLRTGTMAFNGRMIEGEFDFIDHMLCLRASDGSSRGLPLVPRSVADFYDELMRVLDALDVDVAIDLNPKEILEPIPFTQDRKHASYDPEAVHRFWQALLQADRILQRFRGGFVGKSSPVHFFWGSFDLALTRFSGRRAPPRPEADHITQVAYSHEVMSWGFWPGSGNIQEAAFYAYAAPEPPGFAESAVLPRAAFYNPPTKGFILRYEDVRQSADPDAMVREFCQSTYEAGASLGRWDRDALEWKAA